EAIVRDHRGRLDVLFNGVLLVTLPDQGLLSDQAGRAAACALVLRGVLPKVKMAIATGRTELGGPSSIGEAIGGATHMIEHHNPSMGIAIDRVTAALLDAAFEITGDSANRSLVGPRAVELPGRTLLGCVTPMLGREWELHSIDTLFSSCVDRPAS